MIEEPCAPSSTCTIPMYLGSSYMIPTVPTLNPESPLLFVLELPFLPRKVGQVPVPWALLRSIRQSSGQLSILGVGVYLGCLGSRVWGYASYMYVYIFLYIYIYTLFIFFTHPYREHRRNPPVFQGDFARGRFPNPRPETQLVWLCHQHPANLNRKPLNPRPSQP